MCRQTFITDLKKRTRKVYSAEIGGIITIDHGPPVTFLIGDDVIIAQYASWLWGKRRKLSI